MYVREKKIRRGEKTFSYWQVVRSARVDGKSRQTVVKHLGPLPDRLAALVVAKKWGVMCGVEDCTKEGRRRGRCGPWGRAAARRGSSCARSTLRTARREAPFTRSL
jgi:hypothetical protein